MYIAYAGACYSDGEEARQAQEVSTCRHIEICQPFIARSDIPNSQPRLSLALGIPLEMDEFALITCKPLGQAKWTVALSPLEGLGKRKHLTFFVERNDKDEVLLNFVMIRYAQLGPTRLSWPFWQLQARLCDVCHSADFACLWPFQLESPELALTWRTSAD